MGGGGGWGGGGGVGCFFNDTATTEIYTLSLHDALPISKEGALLTKDCLRIDVEAEFYVRVQQSKPAVSLAASTLGRRTFEPERIHKLLSGKFISALRTVASEMTMEEIHESRSSYVDRVVSAAQEGLAMNGLELESVAVTDIDQTDIEYFNPSNRFDAEGLTSVIEVIESRQIGRAHV